MKVKILATGALENYDYSYAARLIEQGKAVAAPAARKAEAKNAAPKTEEAAPVFNLKKEKTEKTDKGEVKAGDA